MIKRLLFWSLALVFIASCGNTKQEKNVDENQAKTQMEAVAVSPADFDSLAVELVGKPITMEGLVAHTCEHGGKRFFITDEKGDVRIKVELGDDKAAVTKELAGDMVKVFGSVKEFRLDEGYLAEWEAEVEAKIAENNEKHDDDGKGLHTGEEGHQDATANDELNQINSLREEIAASGSDHLSFFSIEYDKHEVLKEGELKEAQECAEDAKKEEEHDNDNDGAEE